MNCIPGDIALIIKSLCGNEGKIVQCIKFLGPTHSKLGNLLNGDDYWLIDTSIPATDGSSSPTARDCWLRPIRPTDAPDEMLTLTGLPKKEEEFIV